MAVRGPSAAALMQCMWEIIGRQENVTIGEDKSGEKKAEADSQSTDSNDMASLLFDVCEQEVNSDDEETDGWCEMRLRGVVSLALILCFLDLVEQTIAGDAVAALLEQLELRLLLKRDK